jgi:hypothetical protein
MTPLPTHAPASSIAGGDFDLASARISQEPPCRPILFSGQMVRALLDGRKTQTRRILKPQPTGDVIHYGWQAEGAAFWTDQNFESHRLRIWAGDRLWVRESGQLLREAYDHDPRSSEDLWRDAGFQHSADGAIISARAYDPPVSEWIGDCTRVSRPSIHMPRWASRLTLIVTDVRVQRLQDISEEDARAEGADLDEALLSIGLKATYRGGFSRIWAGIHEPHPDNPTAWGNNPWVAVYEFRVHHCNIDQMETANERAD